MNFLFPSELENWKGLRTGSGTYPEFDDAHDAGVMHGELGAVQGLRQVQQVRVAQLHLRRAVTTHRCQGRVRLGQR